MNGKRIFRAFFGGIPVMVVIVLLAVLNRNAFSESLEGKWFSKTSAGTATLIMTPKDYSWFNRCSELGTYTANGSRIKFSVATTNCGTGLADASQEGGADLFGLEDKSYEYQKVGNSLIIKGVTIGGQKVNLNMTLVNVHVLPVIGKGTVEIERNNRPAPNYSTAIGGSVPFQIFGGGTDDFAEGEGRLTFSGVAELTGTSGSCVVNFATNGRASLFGTYRPSPCALELNITDMYFWNPAVVTKSTCPGINPGDKYPNIIPVQGDWMVFDCVPGDLITFGTGPDNERTYILKDIQLR